LRLLDVLLTAVVKTLADWTQQTTLVINMESHGRETRDSQLNLSRTIGWFTALYPLQINLANVDTTDLSSLLKITKAALRQVPNKGTGYGLLRYLQASQSLDQHDIPISFNYLGQFDSESTNSPFQSFGQPLYFISDEENPRHHLIDIMAWIARGQLHVSWRYNQTIHHPNTVQQLAKQMLTHLRSVIRCCQAPNLFCHIPEDFPLATLTSVQLDTFLQCYPNIENILPLSSLQQGILFHALQTKALTQYSVQLHWYCQNPIKQSAVQQAWQQLVDRHTILRTVIHWKSSQKPLQIVLKKVNFHCQWHDWRNQGNQEKKTHFATFLSADQQAGFDFEKAPVLRVNLFQLTDKETQILISYHHLFIDGWSCANLLNELAQLYPLCVQKKTSTLPQPRPYPDYIAWLIQHDNRPAQRYWQSYLKDPPINSSFPLLQSPQTITTTNTTAFITHPLTPPLSQALQQLTKTQTLTLCTVFQGAWALLLHHYQQTEEVMFGVTVSGRNNDLVGINEMVGFVTRGTRS